MIFDRLDYSMRYSTVHPLFDACMAKVNALIKEDAPVGKYEVEGGAFVLVQEYESRAFTEIVFEEHREYIDIQLITRGEERVFYADASRLTVTEPYKPDAQMSRAQDEKDVHSLILRPGLFVLLYPNDAHAPALAYGEPTSVKKMVVKIPVGVCWGHKRRYYEHFV